MDDWTEALVERRLRDEVVGTKQMTSWLDWLKPDDADLVRARMEGSSWKVICWRFGISRPTADRHWRRAMRMIAQRLNGHQPPARAPRRR